MNDLESFGLGGLFLLLLFSVTPKSTRESILNYFKIAKMPGLTLGGQGTQTSGVQEGSSSTSSPNSTDKVPSNRVLTELEVQSVALSIINKHAFNVQYTELVATAYIESAFDPRAVRDEGFDKSYGLMQVLLGTATDLYNKGFKAYGKPTATLLKDPYASMYFGAAYKHWLKKNWVGKSREWYVRAYNGGPGWEKTANGPANTAKYWERYTEALWALYKIINVSNKGQ